MNANDPSSVTILGVRIDNVTMQSTLAAIQGFMQEPRLHQIATANPEFVMKAQGDSHFQQVLDSAELCIPDGIGLLLAARWLRQPLTERVAGSELVYHLAEQCAQNKWPLFLLGAAEGIAAEAADILMQKYQGLNVVGTYSGSPAESENNDIVHRINQSQASVLYVAYGAPNQDKWIARNRGTLPHVRLAIGVGGSLDFITGKSVRAPQWVQKIGLEWLHRLIKEPWRWRRMLTLPLFCYRVLQTKNKP